MQIAWFVIFLSYYLSVVKVSFLVSWSVSKVTMLRTPRLFPPWLFIECDHSFAILKRAIVHINVYRFEIVIRHLNLYCKLYYLLKKCQWNLANVKMQAKIVKIHHKAFVFASHTALVNQKVDRRSNLIKKILQIGSTGRKYY